MAYGKLIGARLSVGCVGAIGHCNFFLRFCDAIRNAILGIRASNNVRTNDINLLFV